MKGFISITGKNSNVQIQLRNEETKHLLTISVPFPEFARALTNPNVLELEPCTLEINLKKPIKEDAIQWCKKQLLTFRESISKSQVVRRKVVKDCIHFLERHLSTQK